MKRNILSENMARFGTKNLSESAQKKIAFHEALNVIREMGLQNAAIRTLVKEQSQSASTPSKITINYDNGLFRLSELDLGRSQGGNYAYLPTATFTGGGTAGLQLAAITFDPAEGVSEYPEMKKRYTVKLASTATIKTPIDWNRGADALSNIQLNTNDPGLKEMMKAVAFKRGGGADPAMLINSMNLNLKQAIFDALSRVAGEKGWYIGPNKDVATQFALFTNHPGA